MSIIFIGTSVLCLACLYIKGFPSIETFPPFDFSFLSWVCLLPLLFAVKDCSPKKAYIRGLVSGLVFFACLLYWLVNVTVPGTIALVCIMSCVYGLFALAANYVLRRGFNFFIICIVGIMS